MGNVANAVTVAELLATVSLELTATCGDSTAFARSVTVPRIQKPGLALTGWPEQLHSNRLLVMGGTEIEYLDTISTSQQIVGFDTLLASAPACVVVCRGKQLPAHLIARAAAQGIAVLSSNLVTAEFIASVTAFLGRKLAPHTQIHGVLLDVLGIGLLVMGKSGIGKSETALDLVVRGHRLIADDVVRLRLVGDELVGSGVSDFGHHMEIRGLGIINIKDLFGVAAVRETKVIDLVVELVEWQDDAEYDRLGVDEETVTWFGHDVRRVRLPVRPGRNLATLVEVAARNQLLKEQGHHSARTFHDQLAQKLAARNQEQG